MVFIMAALCGCAGAFAGVALTVLYWRVREPATVKLLTAQQRFARAGRGQAYRRRSHWPGG